MLDADRPDGLSRRRAQHVLIASCIDESREAVAAEDVRRDFDGEDLGDATQIDRNAGTCGLVAPDGLDLHRGPHQVAILASVPAALRGVRADNQERRHQEHVFYLQPQPPLWTPLPPAEPSRASCQCAMYVT